MHSLRKCFVDVGCAPVEQTDTESTYVVYKEHKHGTLNTNLFSYISADRERGSFAETVADMEITTRQDALDCLDGLDEQSDDSCSSDDEDDGE